MAARMASTKANIKKMIIEIPVILFEFNYFFTAGSGAITGIVICLEAL